MHLGLGGAGREGERQGEEQRDSRARHQKRRRARHLGRGCTLFPLHLLSDDLHAGLDLIAELFSDRRGQFLGDLHRLVGVVDEAEIGRALQIFEIGIGRLVYG